MFCQGLHLATELIILNGSQNEPNSAEVIIHPTNSFVSDHFITKEP